MKVERKKQDFRSVTITLETQEEFDFLIGLLNLHPTYEKHEARGFNKAIDTVTFNLLDGVR